MSNEKSLREALEMARVHIERYGHAVRCGYGKPGSGSANPLGACTCGLFKDLMEIDRALAVHLVEGPGLREHVVDLRKSLDSMIRLYEGKWSDEPPELATVRKVLSASLSLAASFAKKAAPSVVEQVARFVSQFRRARPYEEYLSDEIFAARICRITGDAGLREALTEIKNWALVRPPEPGWVNELVKMIDAALRTPAPPAETGKENP